MPLIPEPVRIISLGVTRAFRGLRTGDQQTLLVGAALVALGLWRRSSGTTRTLVHRRELSPGESIVVRERRPDDPAGTLRVVEVRGE